MSGRARIESALRAAWRGERRLLSLLLLPLSWLYGLGAALHRALFMVGLLKRDAVDVPVISVGNLVVGGAGKTPVTLELARRLLQGGRKVGVISRGYGRSSGSPLVIVSDGQAVRAVADEGGDEPVLLARRLPGLIVTVAAKRVEAARAAIQLGADLLLMDDGFSHHALHRDVDVVVVDDELGLGNGRLLPAGPLREPASRALRAGLIWLSRCEERARTAPRPLDRRPVVRSRYVADELVDLDLRSCEKAEFLAGKRIIALCGIARPEGFVRTLRELGAEVHETMAMGDHHRFTAEEIAVVLQRLEASGCTLVVTTEKDAMRLAPLTNDERFRALRMDVRVHGDTSALDRLVWRFAPGAATSGEAA